MAFFKSKKYIIAWLAGALLCALISNLALSAFVGFLSQDPGIMKYAEKGESILFPEEADKLSALLSLRVLIGDSRVQFGDVFILPFTLDTSVDFACEEGESPLESGAFLPVCQGSIGSAPINSTIGLVSVEKLCQSSFASDLHTVLGEHPDAVIRLTEYDKDGSLITPISVSVEDLSDNIFAAFKEVNSSESIAAQDVYLYNSYTPGDVFNNSDYCVFQKMDFCFNTPRIVDAESDCLIQSVDFSKGDAGDLDQTQIGFGYTMHRQLNVSENYAMAVVTRRSYPIPLLICILLTVAGWSCILFLIHFIRHLKQRK